MNRSELREHHKCHRSAWPIPAKTRTDGEGDQRSAATRKRDISSLFKLKVPTVTG